MYNFIMQELENNKLRNLKALVAQVVSNNSPSYARGSGFLNLYNTLLSLSIQNPKDYLPLLTEIDEYKMNQLR